MLLISRLKRQIELFFFPFLFSSYCHSVGLRVVSIVSDGCNQSTFVLFYEVLESLYRSVNAIFNAGNSYPSLPPFLIYIYIYIYSLSTSFWDVMPYAWSLVFMFFGQFA